jgi:DNA modification methylase
LKQTRGVEEPTGMPRTPKQTKESVRGMASLYAYYAGYSSFFVQDMIDRLKLVPENLLLDPWNGAGTTTQVAQEKGIDVLGYDLNPTAVLVAKARKLSCGVFPSIKSLTMDLISHAQLQLVDHQSEDSLCIWFDEESAASIRRIEQAIQRVLISDTECVRVVDLKSLARVSDLAAFFYTVLFKVVRSFLAGFRSSNPTWLKIPKNAGPKTKIPLDSLVGRFTIEALRMVEAIKGRAATERRCDIDLASSEHLPLDDESVNAVITSPPYCTRIDYAVSTAPELAVLGMDLRKELKPFRDRMLGTSTIRHDSPEATENFGAYCSSLLDRVSAHPSKAARSYYRKTYAQYLGGLSKSVREIGRVLSPGSPAVLVVQDSYFKDIHVDLAAIVSEFAEEAGLRTVERIDFASHRTMGSVHKHARNYRDSSAATESVVIAMKDGGNGRARATEAHICD